MSRSGTGTGTTVRSGHRRYFFLSYARSPYTSSESSGDTDYWVGEFYKDLTAAVTQMAGLPPSTAADEVAFLDQQIPLGSDWKAVLAEAMGSTDVFVPLYSPGYFNKSWPVRERDAFRERLTGMKPLDIQRHIMPVLWIPFPRGRNTDEIQEALALGADTPAYVENGMRALRMISEYQPQYQQVLNRLARRIVDTARNFQLKISTARRLDDVPEKVTGDAAFIVAVIAPTRGQLPPQRRPQSYDHSAALWRPFGQRQELPVADYAQSAAERLGLDAQVAPISEVRDELDRCPAVVLIDPWVVATKGGEQLLRSIVMDLPRWAVPLVISDRDDPQHGDRGVGLVESAVAIIRAAGVSKVESVDEVNDLVQVLPGLVIKARRRYLREGSYASSKPTQRISLRDQPTAQPHQPEGENNV